MAGHSAIMSVRITGNADDAIRAFEKTTSKAAAFGSFMGGAALKGVTALWDTIKGFGSAVMDMSDSTDKFKNTMSFAGLDTSAVETATKASRQYADATVYDLTTIQNTTAQLAANGIGNYTELTEAAGNLNAVAGGNSDTFKSVAMMLTQTAGAGKLTTENWNQLADAIPGASGKLQEALLKNNAYTGNFRDAMAKGEITADEFNKALVDLGMSDVAREAATSTQTMEGAMGNLEAAVTGGLTDAFDLIKPTVTSAMGVAAEKVTEFGARATQAIKGVISFIRDGDFTAEFAQAFNVSEDSPVVDFLFTLRDTAVGAFDAIKSRAGAVKAGFDQVVQGIGAVLGPVVQFATDALGLTNNLNAGANASQTLGGMLDFVSTSLQAAGQWLQDNAQWLGALVVGVGGAVAAYQAWQTAISVWQTATKIATGVQAAFNLVMNANPIMLVITAIAALVAALVYFFTQTETGRRIWASFTSWLRPPGRHKIDPVVREQHRRILPGAARPHRRVLQQRRQRRHRYVERRGRMVLRPARPHTRRHRQRRQPAVGRGQEHHRRVPRRSEVRLGQRHRMDRRHRRLDRRPQGPAELRQSAARQERPADHAGPRQGHDPGLRR